jgi:hypothetical protein
MHNSSMPRSSKKPRRCRPAIACWLILLAGGCGDAAPFKIVPVSGDLKYQDGTPVKADRIVVTFVPQGVPAVEKQVAAPANGEVDLTDGKFSSLTTREYADGAIVGHHKVLVRAMNKFEELIPAVDARYSRPETTPLEVEVQSGKDNHFSLIVEPTDQRANKPR